ncbi:hypothetical protein, partial [Burkholderia multivorans]|uniref:hypothetical protein n=1 Tax=Burkholderia multivorans TaxID=87883 RepID=UPI001C65FC49
MPAPIPGVVDISTIYSTILDSGESEESLSGSRKIGVRVLVCMGPTQPDFPSPMMATRAAALTRRIL